MTSNYSTQAMNEFEMLNLVMSGAPVTSTEVDALPEPGRSICIYALNANGRFATKTEAVMAGVEAHIVDLAQREAYLHEIYYVDPLAEPSVEKDSTGTNELDILGETEPPPLPDNAHIDEQLGQDISPWLDAYIAYSRLRSPRSYDGFHEACGLWVLSTVAARRVVLHLGKSFFTPLYVALTSRTSLYVKSTAADIAVETLLSAQLDWLLASDDSTPQKFIADLCARVPADFNSMTPELQERARNRLSRAGQRGWYYEEFGQQILAMMREGGTHADFHGILRRFDDCKRKYERATISHGTDVVNEPYLALLAILTPADMRKVAKKNSAMWGDGFWARFAFVTPGLNEERKRDRFPDGECLIPPEVVKPLQQWHKRLGWPSVKVVTDDTGKVTLEIGSYTPRGCVLGSGVYDAYYNYHDGLLDIVSKQEGNTDLDGNYARFAEKAMRVAMLLASLENDGRIEIKHWACAQAIAERWRAGLHSLFAQLNMPTESSEHEKEEKVLKVVERLGNPTAREVAQRIREMKTADAKILLEGLVSEGLLKPDITGRAPKYRLSKA